MIEADAEERECSLHRRHWPRNMTVEFHHVIPVAWQLKTPVRTPPSPGKDPDGRGLLWDDRGVWTCPTGHRSVHHFIVGLMHGARSLQPRDVGAVIAAPAVAVPLHDRRRELTGFALVDPDVAAEVLGGSWSLAPRANVNYASGVVGRKKTYLHRFVVDAPPGSHVHHRNHDGLDCRRENLQVLTPADHAALMGPYFGTRHVFEQNGRWRARVSAGGNEVYLGMFATEEEATEAAAEATWDLYFSTMDGPPQPCLEEAGTAALALKRFALYSSLDDLAAEGEWGQI